MHVIEVRAIVMEVMDIVIGLGCNACDRRDGYGDRHCYRIEAVMHVIDVMAMLMDKVLVMHVIDVMAMVMEVIDIVIGLKV